MSENPNELKEEIKSKDEAGAKSKHKKQPKTNNKVTVDFEPNLHSLFSSMNEAFEALLEGDDSMLMEALSVAGRIKRKQQMRRYRAKIKLGRKRALRRRASNAVIARRARRSAVSAVKSRIAGGRSTQNLSYSERARVEKLAARRKSAIARAARRLIIKKRAADRARKLGGR